ncbi:MAG: YqhA family protein [Candidatus Omnitrophica bacterium]|nr:YqhA family protein [Candidatus Omnitrophota bacterium]MCB9720366.1 YqhA family protein [Candidatus Omnitrophota bacterium]
MPAKKPSRIEYLFESFLWKSRLITLLAVIFSLMASLSLFIAGSYQLMHAAISFAKGMTGRTNYNDLVVNVIGGIDLYLIGIVLLIFSFGVYELFVSKIDPARQDREINILEIKNLDGLKTKLLKVIIMVMIVHFFKLIMTSHPHNPLEILYLAGGVLMISACTYFLRRVED